MENEPKKEETPLQPSSPRLTNDDESSNPNLPAKRVKLSREIISQDEIDKVNAIHERMVRNVGKIAKDAVLAGKILTGIKSRLAHGRWNSWVAANLHFTVRTAVRYMNAYKNRESLLEVGPEVFLRTLWGNEPKKLEASSFKEEPEDEDEDEDEDDDEQSGGEGFGPGLGEPSIFADKGKVALSKYKEIVSRLDREFFENKEFSIEAKREVITELSKWVENKKKNLGA
jgi:hypothetical protein